jgi:hypothetical protein
MSQNNLIQRLTGWLRGPVAGAADAALRPPALPQPPAQNPSYLAAARKLVAMKSGEQANNWLAAGADVFVVDFGDSAASIAAEWNGGVGSAAPVDHEYADGNDPGGQQGGVTGYLAYRGVRRPYALRYERAVDAMIVVATLADLVRNDLEMRLCRDSLGGTRVSFLALHPTHWETLVADAGQKPVDRRFVPVPAHYQELARMAMHDLPEWAATAHGRSP